MYLINDGHCLVGCVVPSVKDGSTHPNKKFSSQDAQNAKELEIAEVDVVTQGKDAQKIFYVTKIRWETALLISDKDLSQFNLHLRR